MQTYHSQILLTQDKGEKSLLQNFKKKKNIKYLTTVAGPLCSKQLLTQYTITCVVIRSSSTRLYVFTCVEGVTFNQATSDTLEGVQTF